jgi:hypothetical protein
VARTASALLRERPVGGVGDAPGVGVVCGVDGIAVVGDVATVPGTEVAMGDVVPAASVSAFLGELESSVQLPMTASSTMIAAPTPLVFGWRRHQDQNRDHRDVPATLFTGSFVTAGQDDHRTVSRDAYQSAGLCQTRLALARDPVAVAVQP